MFIKGILRSLSCVSPVLLVSSADIVSLMLLIILGIWVYNIVIVGAEIWPCLH